MKTNTIYLTVALFVAIILGMVVFTFLARKNLSEPVAVVVYDELPAEMNSYMIERIDAKYFYRDGVHIIVGSLMMPTPCDLLEGSAIIAESMPEQITFAFDVINTAEMCAQVVTEQRFRVDATASQNATIRATFMGTPVALNLIPAGEDEDPEDFELFIKG